MESWYIPITILPGVGLLLMSTSNLVNALTGELSRLIKDDYNLLHDIIERKIRQLSLLNKAMVGFYISSACLVLAGLSGGISLNLAYDSEQFISIMMILGIISILVSLVILTVYSYKAVGIRRAQFEKSLGNNTYKREV
ncbi:MAG: DUF2721 domain-containing protein [Thermonemataceae bacterium]